MLVGQPRELFGLHYLILSCQVGEVETIFFDLSNFTNVRCSHRLCSNFICYSKNSVIEGDGVEVKTINGMTCF